MAKVVRAFSIDPEVARMIDRVANENATWHKKPNKSRMVNLALRWYFTDTNMAHIIEDKDEQIAYWRNKCVSNGGVNVNSGGFLRYLNPFRRRKRE